MGATGPAGSTGSTGSTGPQGAAGSLALYGDGSAGAFTIGSGQTVDLTTPSGVALLPAGFNLQFSSINIVGTLIVPSGTRLRSSGDITISGTVTVQIGAEDPGNSEAPAGISRSSASLYNGGSGITAFQAAQLRPQSFGGGAGARIYAGAGADGGGGGGSVFLLARGNVRVVTGGAINANGQHGVNPGTTGVSIVGTGGGGGGVVIVAAKGSITVGGNIRVNAGNGADGFNGNLGTGEGGGGGGGGGLIHLIASTSPAVTGTLQANGGTAGTNATAVSPSTTILTAGGGGGSVGRGGEGGGIIPGTTTNGNAAAGGVGTVLTTVVPEPETLLIW